MARYKDIFDSIEYATSTNCPNRLLAFTMFRNLLLGESDAAQSAPHQIINRLCNVALENYKMGLWSLDLLQMCALHGGDTFALHLNNQDRLNKLLAYFLSSEKSKVVSSQVKMKIYHLLKTWAAFYKNAFSNNNFQFACDRLKRNNVVINSESICYSHWLPDRDMYGNPLESTSYNLQDVASEISLENKQLHSELRSIFQKATEARNNQSIRDADIQKQFKEASQRAAKIQQMVLASQAFWNDIIDNLENKPSDFGQINSGIRRIFESMEQSINYCTNVLNIEEPPQEKLSDLKATENCYCALCKMQFANQNDLLNHIRDVDHEQQLETRMLIKARTPASLPNGIKKAQGKPMQEPVNGVKINGEMKSTFEENIQVKESSLTKPNAQPLTFAETKLQNFDSNRIAPWYNGPNGLGRPINVQCIDCKVTFSNLDKLLSHPCRSPTNPPIVAFNASPTQSVPQKQSPLPTEAPPVEILPDAPKNTSEKFHCDDCNLDFGERHIYESHLLTPRHGFSIKRRTTGNQNSPEAIPKVPPKPAAKPKNINPNARIKSYSLQRSYNGKDMHVNKKELLGMLDSPLLENPAKKTDEVVSEANFDSIATNQKQNSNQGQSSLVPSKTVGANENPPFKSATISRTGPFSDTIQLHPVLPQRIQEDAISSEMRSLMRTNNITVGRDFLFCNKCCIYLHYDEINKHIGSVDHQTNAEKKNPEGPQSSNIKTTENSSAFAQMPELPPFARVKPIIKDGQYTAIFVPASQVTEQNTFHRSIFTDEPKKAYEL
ncbi:hypothetical protein Aperf_G00000081591 [Anoplocephala perfoliata]